MAIDEMRDFLGTAAEATTNYSAAMTAYLVALKGPYEINGIKYSPPAPNVVRAEVAYWAAQIFRLTKQQPAAPDLSLIQADFERAP